MFINSSIRTSGPLGPGFVAISFMVATIAGTSASNSADIIISAPQTFTETLTEDSTVTVTNTGSIIVDPGTVAFDSAGFNSELILFGPVSASTSVAGTDVNTILQLGSLYNTVTVGQGGDISANGIAIPDNTYAVQQITAGGVNTVNLENATITATSDDVIARGIEQLVITNRNVINFGSNARLSVDGDTGAFGIIQSSVSGDSDAVFAAGTRLDVSSFAFTTAVQQGSSGSGDLTSVFGDNVHINVKGTGATTAVLQTTSSGSASLTFGSGTYIKVIGGNSPGAIRQLSSDNSFILGQNSIIDVTTGGNQFGLNQQPRDTFNRNRAVIQANSRISVVAGLDATGILSTATAPVTSSLTLEHGVEIFASGDAAFGVDVVANGFELQNNGGRIIATSTNAIQESYGVRMDGDNNNFINHGTIFADLAPDSHAILMNGNNNMLSMLTYPVTQGQITFGNGSGTFGTGNTLVMGRGFDAAFTVGADPAGLTVLGQGQSLTVSQIGINLLKVVSIDSDGFFRASSVRMADDLIRFLQQEITTHALKNRTFLYQDNGLIQDFWFDASGFGQHSTTGRAYSHALGAFTIGYDRAFEGNGLGGVYAGYSVGSVNQGNQHWDNTLQTAYAGIYYDRAFDRILTGINLLAGINWDDASRTYLDNTVPGGIVNGSDNGVGFLISPELTVGYELPWRQYLFVPSVGVRYSLFHQDSYSEGGANGLSLSNRNHQQINVRLQVAGIGLSAVNQDATRWNTTLRGGLDIYGNWGDDIDASVMGFDVIYDENLNDGGVRPFIGADVEYLVTDRASLDFGVEGAYDSINAVFGSINAGFSVLF